MFVGYVIADAPEAAVCFATLEADHVLRRVATRADAGSLFCGVEGYHPEQFVPFRTSALLLCNGTDVVEREVFDVVQIAHLTIAAYRCTVT